MFCSKCGHELKDDQLYCNKCGNVIQMVPDYNPIDDELRDHILGETESDHNDSDKDTKDTKDSNLNVQKKEPKRIFLSRRQLFVILPSIILCIILVVVLITSSIDKKRSNSYDYQIEKAYEEEKEGNYDVALEFAGRALVLKPDDYNAKLLLATIYTKLDDTKNAKGMITELLDLYPDKEDPYRLLISVLEKEKDYNKLGQIASEIENPDIEKLFETYLAIEPEFSIKEGTYGHPVNLLIISDTKDPIYYTLDGTEPSDNSLLYEDPILLTEGVTNVSAVTKNSFGVYSNIVKKIYTIKFPIPGIPVIRPASGKYVEPVKIEVLVPENCEAYYTFDGSIPTKESSKYTESLDMPEGNQVFSVIIVNEYGMMSPVEQRNYKYTP